MSHGRFAKKRLIPRHHASCLKHADPSLGILVNWLCMWECLKYKDLIPPLHCGHHSLLWTILCFSKLHQYQPKGSCQNKVYLLKILEAIVIYMYTHTHTHTCMEHYSVLKKILSYAITWINLEDIMLSKINWSQKAKYYMIPVI